MSVTIIAVLCGGSFLVALVACHVLRGLAERHALLDRPNERSLHTKPVPRLGGVGIVLGTLGAVFASLALVDDSASREIGAWLVAGLVFAILGLADDLRGVGAGARFVVQNAFAAGFVLVVGVPTQVMLAPGLALTLPFGLALALWTVFIVGVLNIYNFMDGMDGLAALQAIGASLAISAALAVTGYPGTVVVPLTLGAATAGFYIHNAPPAKIFMGDAGSTFVGFTFAAIALSGASRALPLPVLTVPLALAPFLLDGTFTIFRRLCRGERVWRAHRSHLYQRAVSTGLSHHDVLVRYATWIGSSAVASVVVASHGGAAALVSCGIVLVGLILTVCWVRKLESEAVSRDRNAPARPP